MSGVYLHIPFCASKCPYCDFYSMRADEETREGYVKALLDEINSGRRSGVTDFRAETLYLGGGTPSLLSGDQICRLVGAAKERYGVDGEITVECNPASDVEGLIPAFRTAGVNRVSLGMQSAVDTERRSLGRLSGRERIADVVRRLQSAGLDNISLDVMLGIPGQTAESLCETLEFVAACGAKHVSAYLLKIEEGTFFATHRERYHFADDDTAADLYLLACEKLTALGYRHYEISNFALPGYESRHNSGYWLLTDYLGVGAAAHSFVGGRRFYYPRSIESFEAGDPPVADGSGGDAEEYVMLRLRLADGLRLAELKARYGEPAAAEIIKKAPLRKEQGLVRYDGETLALTEAGMLLSNSVIADFIPPL